MNLKKKGRISNKDLVQELQDRGYFASKAPPQKTGKVFKGEPRKTEGVYRIGVIGDTHMGSRFQQVSHLHTFYKICEDRGVDTVLHAGD